MAHFMSSVSIEESLEKIVRFTDDDGHLRRLVSTLEGGEPVGEVEEWFRLGDRHRHRIEWKTAGYRGWLEASREGQVASIAVGVHTDDPGTGMDARLDAALLELKAAIEAVDTDDIVAAGASRSFVVETIMKGLIRAIPAEQRAAMRQYLERAPELDGSEPVERRRAECCVKWAEALAEDHKAGLARLAAQVEGGTKRVEDTVDAGLVDAERPAESAIANRPDEVGAGAVSPGFHSELNETFDALTEAHKVAAHDGWDAVPWPALLDDLFNA